MKKLGFFLCLATMLFLCGCRAEPVGGGEGITCQFQDALGYTVTVRTAEHVAAIGGSNAETWLVVGGNRCNRQIAKSWISKDDLHHSSAAQQRTHGQSQHGDQRQQGVGEYITPQDLPFRCIYIAAKYGMYQVSEIQIRSTQQDAQKNRCQQ